MRMDNNIAVLSIYTSLLPAWTNLVPTGWHPGLLPGRKRPKTHRCGDREAHRRGKWPYATAAFVRNAQQRQFSRADKLLPWSKSMVIPAHHGLCCEFISCMVPSILWFTGLDSVSTLHKRPASLASMSYLCAVSMLPLICYRRPSRTCACIPILANTWTVSIYL
ncbi:hypothetical protein BC835DRAFT_413675 [Cytidiella melzeri]|nr:hypothetical protein BC835DRAFT_413675 [Cytidiella melzeri]